MKKLMPYDQHSMHPKPEWQQGNGSSIFFQTSLNAAFILDDKGRIATINKQAAETLSVDGHELTGMHAAELFDKRFHDAFTHCFDRVINHCGDTVDMRIEALRQQEGKGFPAQVLLKSFTLDGDDGVYMVLRDLNDRITLENELINHMVENRELKTTIKHLIRSVEQQKSDMRDELLDAMNRQVLGVLENMAREEDPRIREEFRHLIVERLTRLTGKSESQVDPCLLDLSPTEMDICQYIQMGRGTKEIANFTNSSFETIQTHRKNIRKKLGLKGKKITLYAYLMGKRPDRKVAIAG